MSHKHSVYDTEPHFRIDPVTRAIENTSGKVIIMQNDHNSERFTFELPRYIDDHDMSVCNVVEVHYNNIKADRTNANQDVYRVDDLQISPDSDDVVICSWLISQNATQHDGTLNFILRYACVAEDSTVDYQWFSDIYKEITVSEGIFNSEAVATEYSDILEQWRQELFSAVGGGGDTPSAPGTPGTPGVGIASIEQTTTSEESGGVNVVTIAKTDGSTTAFEVRNGQQGEQGIPGSARFHVGENEPTDENVVLWVKPEPESEADGFYLTPAGVAQAVDDVPVKQAVLYDSIAVSGIAQQTAKQVNFKSIEQSGSYATAVASTTDSHIAINKDGFYLLEAQVRYTQTNISATVFGYLYKNGTELLKHAAGTLYASGSVNGGYAAVVTVAKLSAGDKISLSYRFLGSGTGSIVAHAGLSELHIKATYLGGV